VLLWAIDGKIVHFLKAGPNRGDKLKVALCSYFVNNIN
jgi:hypothetical protein